MSRGEVSQQRERRVRTRRGQQPPISIPLWERIHLGVYILAFSLVVLGVGIGVPAYFSQLHMQSPAGTITSPDVASEPALPSTLVGKPAPGFTLKDPYGQKYTFQPGDGKNHLLVFYMGYF